VTLICIKEALLYHKIEEIKNYNHHNHSQFGKKRHKSGKVIQKNQLDATITIY